MPLVVSIVRESRRVSFIWRRSARASDGEQLYWLARGRVGRNEHLEAASPTRGREGRAGDLWTTPGPPRARWHPYEARSREGGGRRLATPGRPGQVVPTGEAGPPMAKKGRTAR